MSSHVYKWRGSGRFDVSNRRGIVYSAAWSQQSCLNWPATQRTICSSGTKRLLGLTSVHFHNVLTYVCFARKAQARLWTAHWQSGWCSPFPGGYTPCSAFQTAERFNGCLKAGMEPNYHLLPMPAASEEIQSSLRSLHLKRQWVTHDEVVTEDLQERNKTPWPGGVLPGCIDSKMQQGDYTQTATLEFTKIKAVQSPSSHQILTIFAWEHVPPALGWAFPSPLASDVYLLPAVTADLKVDERQQRHSFACWRLIRQTTFEPGRPSSTSLMKTRSRLPGSETWA